MKNIGVLLLIAILSLGTIATCSSAFAAAQEDVRAIIFDCDGVLVDTEYGKFLAWKKALESEGVDFSIEEYMPLVGHSSKTSSKRSKKQKN